MQEITGMASKNGLVFRKSGKPIPKSSVHKLLRNPIYMGEFDWKGKRYVGVHEPIVSRELWNKAQDLLSGRYANRNRKPKLDFAFSGLIQCGHCGCSLVAEIKKERYVYYHCSKARGNVRNHTHVKRCWRRSLPN